LIKTIYNDYFKEPIDFDVYKDRDEFRARWEYYKVIVLS
jgi:hypothetical protein